MMRRRGWVCWALFALCACTSSDSSSTADATTHSPRLIGFVADTATDTAEGVWDTVEAPFEDVGIKQDAIPERLQQIVENPYAIPNPLRCDLLRKEIAELDELLGPDVCTPGDPSGNGATDNLQQGMKQGGAFARDKATGYVGSKIGLPFRGLVRKISGAEKHAKALERAYQNGKLRRAFLKGLALSLVPACPVATPAPAKPPNGGL